MKNLHPDPDNMYVYTMGTQVAEGPTVSTGKIVALILATSITTVVLLVGAVIGFSSYESRKLKTTFNTISNTLP
jgi:hypothetical protein